jgi:hypothetical protein
MTIDWGWGLRCLRTGETMSEGGVTEDLLLVESWSGLPLSRNAG